MATQSYSSHKRVIYRLPPPSRSFVSSFFVDAAGCISHQIQHVVNVSYPIGQLDEITAITAKCMLSVVSYPETEPYPTAMLVGCGLVWVRDYLSKDDHGSVPERYKSSTSSLLSHKTQSVFSFLDTFLLSFTRHGLQATPHCHRFSPGSERRQWYVEIFRRGLIP